MTPSFSLLASSASKSIIHVLAINFLSVNVSAALFIKGISRMRTHVSRSSILEKDFQDAWIICYLAMETAMSGDRNLIEFLSNKF